MNSITTSRLAKSIVANPVVWSLGILLLLAAAIVAASTPLLIVSGLLGFGRPLLYSAVLKAGTEPSAAAGRSKRLAFEEPTASQLSTLSAF